MNGIVVRKRFEIECSTAAEVDRRLETLSEAVRERGGGVIDVIRHAPHDERYRASVIYRLPLARSPASPSQAADLGAVDASESGGPAPSENPS